MPTTRPLIVLAYGRKEGTGEAGPLDLERELAWNMNALQPAIGELCDVVELPDATPEGIRLALSGPENEGRVAIFHYSGHANGFRLLIQERDASPVELRAGGFAAYLGTLPNLQLVVLNGCATKRQVRDLHRCGVPGVITVSRKVDDSAARHFAEEFYGEIADGQPLGRSFDKAISWLHARMDSSATRWHHLSSSQASPKALEWSLKIASGNYLFGLPELSDDIGLPELPYRHLEPYTRADARVYFGRNKSIADLHELVNESAAKTILVHGQSGSGKTSLLRAGLFPRLEKNSEVRYFACNTTAHLLDALLLQFAPPADTQTAIPAEDSITPDLIGELWRKSERMCGKHIHVVLDQAESALFRDSGDGSELLQLLTLFAKVLNQEPDLRPAGKLMLCFRKEWLSEIRALLERSEVQLAYGDHFVERLDAQGIVAIIEGPSTEPELQKKYKLSIAPGLAEKIANSLLIDAASPVTPTLQVLLSAMWENAAVDQNTGNRTFDEPLYEAHKGNLGQFLDRQLQTIEAERPELAGTGLSLDLLDLHAGRGPGSLTLDRAQIQVQYQSQQEKIPLLLDMLVNLRLLVEIERPGSADGTAPIVSPGQRRTRLAHDTLAEVVRQRVATSEALAQRAYRALQSRSAQWEQNGTGDVLDAPALKAATEGKPWMRQWKTHEVRLVAESEVARRRDQQNRKRILGVLGVVMIGLLIASGLALYNNSRSRANAQEAEQQRAEADLQRAEAEQQRAEADLQRAEAGLQRAEADLQRAEAETQAQKALEQAHQAEVERENAAREERQALSSQLASEAQIALRLGSSASLPILAGARDAVSLTLGVDGDFTALADATLREAIENIYWRMELPRHRHDSSIIALALNPDGDLLATAARDGTARLWELPSGRFVRTLFGHSGELTSVAFSHDGALLVTAGRDLSVRIWEIASGNEIRHLDGHELPSRTALFSRDDTLVYSGGEDGLVRTWRVDDGAELPPFADYGAEISAMALDPGGKYLAVAGADSTPLLVYETGAPNRVRALLEGHAAIQALAYSSSGRQLALGSVDGTALVLDTQTWETTSEYRGHQNAVLHVAFSPDGAKVVSTDAANIAKIWESATATEVLHYAKHASADGDLQCAAFSRDGSYVVSAGDNGRARLWDSQSGQDLTSIGGHSGAIFDVAFDPSGAMLASAGGDKTWRLWNTVTGDETAVVWGHDDNVESIAFSPDGKTIVTGSEDGTLALWVAETQALIAQWPAHTAGVRRVLFSPDGSWLASVGADNYLRIWSADTYHLLRETVAHPSDVWALDIDPAGENLASGGTDTNLRLWRSASLTLTLDIDLGSIIRDISFSPDGLTVGVALESGRVVIVDVQTGVTLRLFEGHTGVARSVEFDGRGELLASGSDDKTVRLWSVSSGIPVAVLEGHSDSTRALSFSPNGDVLASGSGGLETGNYIVRLWNTKPFGVRNTAGPYDAAIRTVALSPDGRTLISGSDDNLLRMTDFESADLLGQRKADAGRVRSVAYSPDGATLLTAGEDATLRLWDADQWEVLRMFMGHELWIRSAVFSSDGRLALSASEDRTVRVWSLESSTATVVYRGHTDIATHALFLEGDGQVISTGFDGTVQIWDARTGAQLHTLKLASRFGNQLAISADGALLAVGTGEEEGENAIEIWDMRRLERLQTIDFPRPVRTVAFSPDGQWFAAAAGQTIRLWQRSGEALTLVRELSGHTGVVWSLLFSGNSNHLVSASEDGTLRFWPVHIESLLAIANAFLQPDPTVFRPEHRSDPLADLPAEAPRTVLPSDLPVEPAGPGATAVSPAATVRLWTDEVLVPAGAFQMGCSPSDPICNASEYPLHEVYLSAFAIDRYEVTNERYAGCVDAGACTLPMKLSSTTRRDYFGNAGFASFPVVNVTWVQAYRFCAWEGKRLPSEAEWEKAARGEESVRIFPWGDQASDCTLVNKTKCAIDITEVGSYPAGAGPYGTLDQSGNAWEWVNDWSDKEYYLTSPRENPRGPANGLERVRRGGSWVNTNSLRVSNRQSSDPFYWEDSIGFRCARTLPLQIGD